MKFPKQINVPLGRGLRLRFERRPNWVDVVLERHTHYAPYGFWYYKSEWAKEVAYPWPSAIRKHRERRYWREAGDRTRHLEQAGCMHSHGCSAKTVLKHTGVDISDWEPTPWDVAAARQKAEA